jgi:hypothetical protein
MLLRGQEGANAFLIWRAETYRGVGCYLKSMVNYQIS